MLPVATEFSVANSVLFLSLCTAYIYQRHVHSQPSIWRMIAKASSTSLLSMLSAVQGGPTLLSAALVLGSIADAFLAWDGETAFLAGLGSFLTAHVLYIYLFGQLGSGPDVVLQSSPRLAAASVLVLVFAPVMVSQLMPKVARDLRAPILVYTTAIVMMVLAALTLDKWLVVSGALMFTASDTILSMEKFLVGKTSKHRRWMPYAVWALYYAGQLQIALGVLG